MSNVWARWEISERDEGGTLNHGTPQPTPNAEVIGDPEMNAPDHLSLLEINSGFRGPSNENTGIKETE
jgi:hypothetical protein